MIVKIQPDDVTAQALKRLRSDTDMQHVIDWLSRVVFQQDEQNRVTADGVGLRMGQGAAQALAVVTAQLAGERAKGALERHRATGRESASDTKGTGLA